VMHPGRAAGFLRLHPLEKGFFAGQRSHKPRPTDGASPLPVLTAMWSTRTADGLVVRAPAKVNLFLEVLGKRPDGYHDLATLMVAVTLEDELGFERDNSGVLSLTCDNPDLPCGPENLVLKAAERLRQHTGCRDAAKIRLAKR